MQSTYTSLNLFTVFSHQHKLEHRIVVVQCIRVSGWAMFWTSERLKILATVLHRFASVVIFFFFFCCWYWPASTSQHELLRNGCTRTHSQKDKLRDIDFYTYLNQRGERMKRRRQLKYYLKTKPEALFENWLMCSEWFISRNGFYCLNDVVNSEYTIDFYFNKIFVSEVRIDGKRLCNNNRLSVNQKKSHGDFFFFRQGRFFFLALIIEILVKIILDSKIPK